MQHLDASISGTGENWNCKWEFENGVVEVTDFANFFMIIVWSVWVVVKVLLVCRVANPSRIVWETPGIRQSLPEISKSNPGDFDALKML